MACLVTLLGVFCQLEPFVILQRAVIAALLVGFVVALTVALVDVGCGGGKTAGGDRRFVTGESIT